MRFVYQSITYQVTSLNGFHIHNDTKFVLVVGSDGSKKISEWVKVKKLVFKKRKRICKKKKIIRLRKMRKK
jgi:nicotinic acid mononucleotide adenylyltransferase